jgi:hypothetical protein
MLSIEHGGDLIETEASSSQLANPTLEPPGHVIVALLPASDRRCFPTSHGRSDRKVVRAEHLTSRFGGRHRGLRANRRSSRFVLGDGRKNLQYQAIRARYVTRGKAQLALKQLADEARRSRQPIKPRDHKQRSRSLGTVDRFAQHRPRAHAAALDLEEFLDQLMLRLPAVPLDGGSLSVDTETARPLVASAHAQIRDGRFHGSTVTRTPCQLSGFAAIIS